jgi:diguanylate cyclase (GGDEF)-like protein/PAS domain S-box-containing protein
MDENPFDCDPAENLDEDANPGLGALHILNRLVCAIEHVPMVAIQSIDRNGAIRLWNRTSVELYGIPTREALGKPLADMLLLGDKKEEFDAAIAQIWETGQPTMPRDWQVSTPSGSQLWVYTTMFPVFLHGKVDQIFCMDVDITERKREEQALFCSGAYFRAMFEKSADAIILVRNNQYIDINPAALKLFGCSEKSAIVGRSADYFSPLIQPDGQPSLEKLQQMCALAQQYGNHRFEWMYINCDHQPFWTEKLLISIQVEGELLMYAVVRDISARKAAEQSLRLAAQVFENSREGILITDQDQRIILVNRAFTEITGYTAAEALGNTPRMLSSGMQNQAFYQGLWQALGHNDHWEGEIWDRRRNNETYPMWESITVVRDANHQITNYFSIFSDITERKRAEAAHRESEERFRGAFESAVIGMALVGLEGQWLKVNQSLCRLLGYSEQELCSMTFNDLTHPDDIEAGLTKVHQLLAGEIAYFRMEKRYFHKDGHTVWAILSVSLVRDGQGHPVHFVAQIIDITERKEDESRTRYLAEHDLLTGLPSRAMLLDRLGQAIAAARRNKSQLAILFIDLDRFKNINDSMGHSVGDKLLQEVARYLNQNVRSVDTVSRQGGDEFVILLTEIGGVEQAARVADNVMKAIASPYRFDGYEFNITSSIGISIYPTDGEDMDTLIKNADVAMYHAKESGRNHYQFFSSEMNTRIVERLTLEKNLRTAIERNEFVLQYQPETEIVSGRTVGVEALIRWQHPDFGLLLPAHFIRVAEECGLIVPIGDWVLRTACLQAKAWRNQGYPLLMSVNLSVAQFRQKNLLQSVIDALRFADLAPQFLELEITEGILINEADNTLETLRTIRNLGVKLAIDDFGTGYSSLSYLKRFSVDKLKIDQSFVRDLTFDPEDATIISAIIAMAKNLNLKVIAEGVETVEQFHFLEAHGCDEYQGFYTSRALSPNDLTAFIEHSRHY